MIFEKQDYQQECIENIITLLENFNFKHQSAENLKDCFAKFHTQIPIKTLSNKLNIDILMETGTGKTFTYLNLIFELHKVYKQNKFIIFVPRKAILESVKQNIRLTKDYFYNQYNHHLKIYTYEGSKSQSAIINHYIKNTDELSVFILTNSAMDKKDNILNKTSESLFDTKSIFENIAALNPISIIDEPHLLKGEAFNAYFSKVKTLYFRFGATFPKEKGFELSNVAYCLDSISAFRKYLVKQIRVHTISKDSQAPFLLSADSKSAKLSFLKAGIEKHDTFIKGADLGRLDSSLSGVNIVKTTKDKAYLSNGDILEKLKSYKLQDSEITTLLKKAIDLHFEKEAILFAQNIKALSLFFIPNIEDFREVEGKGAPFIKNEFERLYKQKRKEILSDPHLPQNYKDYLAKDFDESGNLRVHQGYFSGDSQGSTKKKENTKENIEANDIKMILGQKEKLLSFDIPLRFIFSVWALQEGWDNPNIFTLTKLANSSSDTSRHQQVGRGLRICVNSEGKRITHRYLDSNDNTFFDINYLDMLISGEELGFIEGLQNEIMESSFVFGGDFIDGNVLNEMIKHKEKSDDFIYLLRRRLKVIEYNEENNTYKIISPIYEAIKDNEEAKEILGDDFEWVLERFKESNNKHDQLINANKSQEKVKIRKELAKDFKELWHTINAKAQLTYHNIQKQALIDSIAHSFNQTKIEKESITYERKIYDAKQNRIIIADSTTLKDKDYKKALQKELSAFLLDFAKDSHLPLKLIYEIYNALNHENFYNSPKKAFATLKNIIADSLHANLLSCVSYEFCQNAFSNATFTFAENDPLYTSKGEPKDEIYKHKLGRYESKEKPSDKYLYDKGIYDSNIEEQVILENVQNVEGKSIEVFAKLPKFSIPTPFKAYQPDFAYLLKDEKGQKIFFVCETKGYDKESDIPAEEKCKIDYAKRFFESLQRNLKNTKVIFTTRINKQSLLDTIKSTLKDKV